MRDVGEWIRGTLAARPEADGEPSRAASDARVAGILFVHSRTLPRNNAATLLVPKCSTRRLPLSGNSVCIVDVDSGRVIDTVALSEQLGCAATGGDTVHNADPSDGTSLRRVLRSIALRTRPLQEALLQVKDLTAVNRRKDEFLAILGHELRTPLSSIKNAVNLLTTLPAQSPARLRAHALIQRQVQGMTQLVEDLLDVSRISHGHLQLRREQADLRVIVNNAIETMNAAISARKQLLAVEMPHEPVWLHADPLRLEQVFVNLLANASRYTDAGGDLALRVHMRDSHAVVHIRDTGIGISPDSLPIIFDLFRQAQAGAPRSQSGLGIGLALVRSLVQLHGGTVTAASRGLGLGSEFVVRLPQEA